MNSIVDPRGIQPEAVRFSLSPSVWDDCAEYIEANDIEVVVEAKQYIEYCLEKKTQIIAIQGKLYQNNIAYDFTAQLDSKGYGLYVDNLANEDTASRELKIKLRNLFGKWS